MLKLPSDVLGEVGKYLTGYNFINLMTTCWELLEKLKDMKYTIGNLLFTMNYKCTINMLKNNNMLRYVKKLSCRECNNITDEMLLCFDDLCYLDISYCKNITDKGFRYLKGFHTLDMEGCDQETITDEAFKYLKGIHTLNMGFCNQETITDESFKYLKCIHTLDMEWCDQKTITDEAFKYLKGIHTLDMEGCSQETITKKIFESLKGIHTLDIDGCTQL